MCTVWLPGNVSMGEDGSNIIKAVQDLPLFNGTLLVLFILFVPATDTACCLILDLTLVMY